MKLNMEAYESGHLSGLVFQNICGALPNKKYTSHCLNIVTPGPTIVNS